MAVRTLCYLNNEAFDFNVRFAQVNFDLMWLQCSRFIKKIKTNSIHLFFPFRQGLLQLGVCHVVPTKS